MVQRSFFAIDSANMVIDSSSNGGIVGGPIINNSDTPNGTIYTYSAGGGTTVTLDDVGGNTATFDDDDENNHTIIDGGGIVANGNGVEAESIIEVRALDDLGNPTGPVITLSVFSQNGVTGSVWGFSSDTDLVHGVSYIKTGGSNIGDSDYDTFITCFGPGTDILTRSGNVPADQISPGDLVWTLNDGFQPVRWTGRSTVDAQGAFAPVVFAPGSIGNSKELVVSQEHRIHLRDCGAELLFGASEILVAAKHLCGLPGVALRPGGPITYVHFMFDKHQIVSANAVESESFFLSDLSISGVEAAQRRELLALFPCLKTGMGQFGSMEAMPLRAFEATVLREYLRRERAAG